MTGRAALDTFNGKAAPPVALFARSVGGMIVVVCNQMSTINKMGIENRIGALPPFDLDNNDKSLKAIPGL